MATPNKPHLKTQPVPRQPKDEPVNQGLERYVGQLHNRDRLSELILSLEAIRNGEIPPPGSPQSAALQKLTAATGMSLHDDATVRRAIVALGDRSQALSRLEHIPGSLDASSMALSLLKAADSTRQRLGPEEDIESALHQRIAEVIHSHQVSAPQSPHSERWWTELEDSAHRRLVPAFARISPKLNELDDAPVRGALLRSPLLLGILFALPALMTIPLPVSTPLACLLMGLFGAFVIHPAWVSRLRGQVNAIGESLAQEGPRLARISGEGLVREGDFELDQVLGDLIPILEGERLAGRTTPEAMAPGVEDYLEEITPIFEEVSPRSPAYLQGLRDLTLGPLLREYGTWAKARAWVESNWLGGILDVPRRLALTLGLFAIPLAVLAARISPLPQIVDIPLMVGLMAAIGFGLSSALPGTLPSRSKLIEGLKARQSELDELG